MSSPIKYKDEQKENPLIAKSDLFEAALNEFSKRSFNEASLNDMLKAVKMNKGSFYHRFYDKKDLYLCMMERIAVDKMEYLHDIIDVSQMPEDFFDNIRLFAFSGLEYARHEKRYYGLWRHYLSESSDIKETLKKAFPGFGDDLFEALVAKAIASGNLTSAYSQTFICKTISIYFYNLDDLLPEDPTDEDIATVIDQFIRFLKHGLLATE